jgi:hypothetical protein
VGEATAKCSCGGSQAGDCFVAHSTPGCNDLVCCNAVCDDDPFCCDVEWDNFCVTGANQRCCGGTLTPSCFVAHPTPACDIASCCDFVCALDPFCCNVGWDQLCVNQALAGCTCGGATAGSCFAPQPHPGCDDAVCCAAVCDDDPFCCDVEWDNFCVTGANQRCCGGSLTPSCFVVHPTPGCDFDSCCDAVCVQDPSCCNVDWDQACVNQANAICTCGGAAAGSCFTEQPHPGCGDAACCDEVCERDPYCCADQWDVLCADLASVVCCAGPAAGSCFEIHEGSACSSKGCCGAVCVQDPFCCDVTWDANCVDLAQAMCTCGGSAAGDCFTSHLSPGCSDPDCCAAVCAILPICCDVQWIGLCIAIAQNQCASKPDGDVNDDGVTNVDDLVIVVLDWGCQAPPPGCQGDANADAVTNVADLVTVILGWSG